MNIDLAGVAQKIKCQPANQKVAGSISSQGTCLGFSPGSPVGGVQEAINQCISCALMFLSLFFSLPSPLPKEYINKMF